MEKIKVLIVDDSPFTIDYLKKLLGDDSEIKVIGFANNGKEAVKKTKELLPDVIVMDIEMPIMSGIEATEKIMKEKPTPIVILTSSLNTRNLYKSFDAIKNGALEILNKPTSRPTEEWDETIQNLLDTIKRASKIKVLRKKTSTKSKQQKADLNNKYSIIAINSSTGGPRILNDIFSNLNENFNLPILVAQHIPAGFTLGLVDWLNIYSPLNIKIAEDDEILKGGNIYFPPDGAHLTVRSDKIKLLFADPIRGIRPSGNILFESVANNFGKESIGIILTGMGTDGLNGAKKIKGLGGLIIAQEPNTTIVAGMPEAVIKNNLADLILNPTDIINKISEIEELK
jgi:two-component system chemotaxis response regulator CheB